MNTNSMQGKDHKVAATHIEKEAGFPQSVVQFLSQAEDILRVTMLSYENHDFISSKLKALYTLNGWDCDGLDTYEFRFQANTPDDIRVMIEDNEDWNTIADCLILEIGAILDDLQNEHFYLPLEEVEWALYALNDFMDIIREYELQNLFDWNLFTDTDRVFKMYEVIKQFKRR